MARKPQLLSVLYNSDTFTLHAFFTDGTTRTHPCVRPAAALKLSASRRKYGGYSMYPQFTKQHPPLTPFPDPR